MKIEVRTQAWQRFPSDREMRIADKNGTPPTEIYIKTFLDALEVASAAFRIILQEYHIIPGDVRIESHILQSQIDIPPEFVLRAEGEMVIPAENEMQLRDSLAAINTLIRAAFIESFGGKDVVLSIRFGISQ
jgi:hypothetical protein